MEVLLAKYINIIKLFLLVEKLMHLTFNQNLFYHFLINDKDHNKNMYKQKNVF